MLAAIVEILFELFLELVIQIIADIGIFETRERTERRPSNPLLVFLGYAFIAAAAGMLSLKLFPEHMIQSPDLRILNLILTPICAGLAMSWIGQRRRSLMQEPLRLDTFITGAGFALIIGLIRHFGAE